MPRAAPPAHAPGKQGKAGRLCTGVRVRRCGPGDRIRGRRARGPAVCLRCVALRAPAPGTGHRTCDGLIASRV